MAGSILPLLLPLLLAPLLQGIINRTKALMAGRHGQPLLQPYHDLFKLLRKGAVYSRTTTWVFRTAPLLGLAAVLVAAALLPFGGEPAALAFPGDLVLFAALLALMRAALVLAALDTGSSFEAMGASREVTFAALLEPALLLSLAAAARRSNSVSLTGILGGLGPSAWTQAGPTLALLAAALLVVFLAENARLPIDDPTTHLELTMIHEVMVLDHGGPDLAFILYAAALKLWLLGALLVGLLVPATSMRWVNIGVALAALVALAILTGLIESTMARWRLQRVSQLLIGAGALAAVAALLMMA